MKKRLIVIIMMIVMMFGVITPVFAQTVKRPGPLRDDTSATSSSPSKPPGKITPIKKGIPSPYDGVIFSPAAVAWLLAQQEAREARIKIERNNATVIAQTKCIKQIDDLTTQTDADKRTMQVQMQSQAQRLKILERLLTDAEKQSSSGNIVFWTAMGSLGGILVTLGTVFVVNQSSK